MVPQATILEKLLHEDELMRKKLWETRRLRRMTQKRLKDGKGTLESLTTQLAMGLQRGVHEVRNVVLLLLNAAGEFIGPALFLISAT